MDILLVMCVGIFVGKYLMPKKWKNVNEKLQISFTLLLIFSMGVTLGQKENFLNEVANLGIVSFIFF